MSNDKNMKLENGRVSILFNNEGLKIELKDADSGIHFATVILNKEQTCEAMSRFSHTHCIIEVLGLEYVGKKQEFKEFLFEIEEKEFRNRREDLSETCLKELKKQGMEEWKPDNYYGSKNSFLNKDGKGYARTIIRRWI